MSFTTLVRNVDLYFYASRALYPHQLYVSYRCMNILLRPLLRCHRTSMNFERFEIRFKSIKVHIMIHRASAITAGRYPNTHIRQAQQLQPGQQSQVYGRTS